MRSPRCQHLLTYYSLAKYLVCTLLSGSLLKLRAIRHGDFCAGWGNPGGLGGT